MTPAVYSNRRTQNWLPSIFNEIFNDEFMGVSPAKRYASPAINIIENEKYYQIELAAPGMTKQDFSIRLENENEISIKLEKKEEKHNERNYLRREFSYASYQQSFIIPEDVVVEQIEATMNDGILTITLPKKIEETKTPVSRQIEIK